MDFSNNVFVITGASGGIGKVLCEILIKLNARVIGVYNNTIITNKQIDSFKCDISKEDEVIKLFNYVKEKYKNIDVLVNCAAFCADEDYLEKSADSFNRVIAVNLTGTFLMMKYASLLMNNNGVILNISSMNASKTYNVLSMDYDASKAGVENLTKNFAQRLKNLKICALAPGWIDTDAVKEMDPKYLKEELKRVEQEKLLRKEDVALKIIEIIVNNDDYVSGEIIYMEG